MEGLGKYHGSHVTHSHQQFMDFDRFLSSCLGLLAAKVLHLSGSGDSRGLPISGRLVGEIQSDTATVYSKARRGSDEANLNNEQYGTKEHVPIPSRARSWRALLE